MNLFEISINIIESAIAIIFLSLYFEAKRTGIRKHMETAAAVLLSAAVISILNYIHIYEGFMGLIVTAVYFIYTLISLKGKTLEKMFIASVADCCVLVTNVLFLLIAHKLFGVGYEHLLSFSAARIIYIASAKLAQIAIFIVLLKYKLRSGLSTKNIWIVIALILTAEFSMSIITKLVINYDELDSEFIIISLCVVFMIIISYCMFIRINIETLLRAENIALKQKAKADRAHTRELKDIYEKTYGVMHDLNIYFSNTLRYLNEAPQKAREYIQGILNDDICNPQRLVKTDNDCFNAIADAKLSVCEKENIHVYINIKNQSLKELTDDEVGSIFGNLFDNAIRSAKDSTEKFIELDVKPKGEYISIIMTNSISEPILNSNPELSSTKDNKDDHGYGIKNIRRIVENHHGIVNFFEEGNIFGCHILIGK